LFVRLFCPLLFSWWGGYVRIIVGFPLPPSKKRPYAKESWAIFWGYRGGYLKKQFSSRYNHPFCQGIYNNFCRNILALYIWRRGGGAYNFFDFARS